MTRKEKGGGGCSKSPSNFGRSFLLLKLTQRRRHARLVRVQRKMGERIADVSPKYKPYVRASEREREEREKNLSDSILYLFQRCPAVPWPPDLVATTAPRYTQAFLCRSFYPRKRARGNTRTHPSIVPFRLSRLLNYTREISPRGNARERAISTVRNIISPRRERDIADKYRRAPRATVKGIRRVSTDILGGLGK